MCGDNVLYILSGVYGVFFLPKYRTRKRRAEVNAFSHDIFCFVPSDSCTKIEALAVEEYGPITKLSLELALQTKWATLQAMG